jgi:hypothetical protein
MRNNTCSDRIQLGFVALTCGKTYNNQLFLCQKCIKEKNDKIDEVLKDD